MHTSVRVITSKTRDEMEREVPNIRDLIMEDTTQAEMAQARFGRQTAKTGDSDYMAENMTNLPKTADMIHDICTHQCKYGTMEDPEGKDSPRYGDARHQRSQPRTSRQDQKNPHQTTDGPSPLKGQSFPNTSLLQSSRRQPIDRTKQ